MQKIKYLLLISLFLAAQSLFAVEADDILGVWKTATTENGYSQVEIYKENGRYQGKIIYLSEPNYTDADIKRYGAGVVKGEPRTDMANPNKSKRKDPIQGLKIVSDFVLKGNQWKNGRVYDPESGKTYKGKMWLNKDGSLSLRGFVGISAFGRSTVWTRVAEDDIQRADAEDTMSTDKTVEEVHEFIESASETTEETL